MKKIILIVILSLFTSQGVHSEEIKWKEIDDSQVDTLDYGEDYKKLKDKWISLIGSNKNEFRNIETLGFLVEFIKPIYGFTTDDIIKHVYNRLKSSLSPSVNLCNTIELHCADDGYIYIRLILLKNASSIEVNLQRNVFLPDNLSEISKATVWNKTMLLSGTTTYSRITDNLDQILDGFAYEFNRSKEFKEVDKEITKIMKEAGKKDKDKRKK